MKCGAPRVYARGTFIFGIPPAWWNPTRMPFIRGFITVAFWMWGKQKIFLRASLFFCIFLFLNIGHLYPSGDDYSPFVKPFGFTHLWGFYDNTQGENYGEDFKIARARFGIQGNISANLGYMLLTEWGSLTYDDPATLLDVWVNYKLDPAFNVKIGQTWYKFTISGTEVLPKIPFIFRPEVIDGIWLPMGRNGSYGYDRGVELWGKFEDLKFPCSYFISTTAGSGLDNFEDNAKKDFTGRLTIEPKKDLTLGLSGFYGYSRVNITSNLRSEEKKDLPEYVYAVEASYTNEYFRFIYEYLDGLYEGYLDIKGAEIFQIDTKKPRGWYTMLGFKPLNRLEIPIRYAWYEKDSTRSDTGLETVTVGITWFIKAGYLNNIKLNYIIRNAEINYGSKPKNMIALQVQLVF